MANAGPGSPIEDPAPITVPPPILFTLCSVTDLPMVTSLPITAPLPITEPSPTLELSPMSAPADSLVPGARSVPLPSFAFCSRPRTQRTSGDARLCVCAERASRRTYKMSKPTTNTYIMHTLPNSTSSATWLSVPSTANSLNLLPLPICSHADTHTGSCSGS
jgi:hypothetical protein